MISFPFTVFQVALMGRYPHLSRRGETRQDYDVVEAALARADVADLAPRAYTTLSGGEQGRINLARALAQETGALLLDEPTTFLDIAHQVDMLDLVRRLNREHDRTIVMVLHDLGQACRYADHLVVMKDGAVVATGAPREVLTESLVREVFEIDVHVLPDPVTGTPIVLPRSLEGADPSRTEPGGRVDGVS